MTVETAIAPAPPSQSALAAPGQWSREQIDLLKRTYCRGGTDDEFKLFMGVCQRTGLDPFTKQIHAVKRWDSGLRREVMSFQTGIDGFRTMSERTGAYEGTTKAEWCGEDGKWVDVWLSKDPPAAARIGVYRKGFRDPVLGVALFREYVQTTKEGNPNRMWATMPANQLAKCAEALAHRKAFPQTHTGLYTYDEMGQSGNVAPLREEPAPVDPPESVQPSTPASDDIPLDVESKPAPASERWMLVKRAVGEMMSMDRARAIEDIKAAATKAGVKAANLSKFAPDDYLAINPHLPEMFRVAG